MVEVISSIQATSSKVKSGQASLGQLNSGHLK